MSPSKKGRKRNKRYRNAILEVLYQAKNDSLDEEAYEGSLYISKITERIENKFPNISRKGKNEGLPKSTVSRHMKTLLEENIVEEVSIPSTFNRYTNKGFRITKKGEKEVKLNSGKLYAELAGSLFYEYILERYKSDCDSCDENEEECIKNAIQMLSKSEIHPTVDLNEIRVQEAASKANNGKEVKEMAYLILSWAYLSNAIEQRYMPDEIKDTNEALKMLSIRDPRVADVAFSTYRLPMSDIVDIYKEWGLDPITQMPVDQYISMMVVYELQSGDEAVSIEQVKKRSDEMGIMYDPSNSLAQCSRNGFLEEIDSEPKSYKLDKEKTDKMAYWFNTSKSTSKARKKIWENNISDPLPLADDVDLDKLAENHMISEEKIKDSVSYAVQQAFISKKEKVYQEDFIEGIEK